MASSPLMIAKDDPMDLGPFLKEYVLNNPFSQMASNAPPVPRPMTARALPVVAVKSRPLLAPSPPQIRSNSQSPHTVQGVPTTISQIPVLAVKAITSPIVHQVSPIVHHQQHPSAPTINPMALRLAASGNGGSIMVPLALGQDTGIIDTPKAHIGSNRNFAAMLREAKLPIKHMKVKKWLLGNYRYRGNSPNWLSSDDLLEHSHEKFEDLKGSVMSRIMKVTFPHCHKVINKYGYFYIGLVRRPEKQHYGDEILRMAAEAVSSGHMTRDMACQVHGITSELLDRMVVWFDTINDPVPDEKQVMTEDTTSESDSNQPPASRGNLKWKLRQKARSRLLHKIKEPADWESSPDFDWTPENNGERPYAACRARKRRRRTTSVGEDEVSVKKEKLDDDEDAEVDIDGSFSSPDDDTRMDAESGSSEASLPMISSVHGNVTSIIGSVKVKSEPVDPEYDLYEPNNNNNKSDSRVQDKVDSDTSAEEVRASFHTLRNLLSERPASEALKVAAAKSQFEDSEPTDLSNKKTPVSSSSLVEDSAIGATGITCSSNNMTRPQSLNSVVDLLTMKQELQRTRDDLNTKTSQNTELERKLDQAHGQIEQLNRTASTQESQLFDLASEFFDLSNRFMKMTHKFKQALTDVKNMQSSQRT